MKKINHKRYFLGISLLFTILIFTIPQIRYLIESVYIKHFTSVKIEKALPTEKALLVSYYAKKQLDLTTSYDGSYKNISYPNGDINITTGVCTDVVVRALRGIDIDLQKLIHEDMLDSFLQYPSYGLKKPDSNIDHRRVPNIQKYFERQGYSLPISDKGIDYKPGDIVTWNFWNWNHIGIVSNIKKEGTNRYYIVHNAYNGTELSDWLFMTKITGHYRIK